MLYDCGAIGQRNLASGEINYRVHNPDKDFDPMGHFLMHPEPRTRDIFLDYARDAYKGRLRGARGLAERLGLESGALDQQFIEYLNRTAPPQT